MAKYILNSNSVDKPYYLPISKKLYKLYEKYQLDIKSNIQDLYITESQKHFLQGNRAKNFFFVTWLPKQIVLDILEDFECLDVYAISPLHDCDKFENGEPKKPHFHIILRLSTNYQFSKIAYEFHTLDIKCIGENWFNQYNYLTHNSDKCRKEGKYQYAESDILSNNLQFVKSRSYPTSFNNADSCNDIINDMLAGMSTYLLCMKYGNLFIYHKKQLEDVCIDITYEQKLNNRYTKFVKEKYK